MTDISAQGSHELGMKHLRDELAAKDAEIERLRSTTEISPVHVQGLQADNERLRAALQEIADMRYDNTSAATIARRALEPKP